MDELVRRLREFSDELTDEAAESWPETASRLKGRALELRQAADALTTLTAALEGLVAQVQRDTHGVALYSQEMAAARAALRDVGRG